MDSPDVARDLVHRLADAFNRKDAAAVARLYQPDITYWSALSGTNDGAEAVLGHIRHLFHTLPDEQMSPRVVITDGSTVVVEFVSRGLDGAGEPYEVGITEVITVRDGLLADIRVYLDPEAMPRTH